MPSQELVDTEEIDFGCLNFLSFDAEIDEYSADKSHDFPSFGSSNTES